MKNFVSVGSYTWQYQSEPHAVISGASGSGKSFLLHAVIHELKNVAKPENIIVCDCKFSTMKKVSEQIFQLPNVAKNIADVKKIIDDLEQEMERRYTVGDFKETTFLVIDEFACMRLIIDKKEFDKIDRQLKHLILKSREANIFIIIGMQQPNSQDLPTSLRDSIGLKIGLKNLSSECFKMLFNRHQTSEYLEHKETGEGYIQISGGQILPFVSPYVEID